jgi:hypothetical protein
MKKIFTTIILMGFISINAQEISKNALGIRLGNNDGLGTEISYQRALSLNNRLEIDLGLRNSNNINAFKIVGLYQWVWKIENNFNWYAGAGAGLASWKSKDFDTNGNYFLGAGNIGIEYFFNIPLLVSLDFRPEFYLGDGLNDSFGSDIALSVRYQF